MSKRTLIVRLKAEMGGFKPAMDSAAKSVKGVADAADRTARSGGVAMRSLSQSIRANRQSWDDLSSTALKVGTGLGIGLGLATKAAIDWESAWAGVTKTIDGTPEQYAELEQGLRGLAKTLPATHAEIAGVAEAAGQLGIARQDIVDFTEVAIALGESTNLTADQAAEGLAKISNVMGTSAREGVAGYEKLGTTLVALGNAGASTEADILAMTQRLTGAGNLIGATEADLLALANAASSVGIESELGGGALQRAMLEMNSAVKSGSGELEDFARTAGMTSQEFARLWGEDPVEALRRFTVGLGEVNAAGGDVSDVLSAVGLGGTQNAQVLLRLAGASDVLTDSLRMGAEEWENGTALQDEASKRYETTASRMQIAQNSIKDAAIDLGSVAGPVLAGLAEKAASAANAFVQLPAPVKNSVTAIAGLATAAALIGGGTIKVVGWAQDLGDALEKVGMKGPRTEAALDRTGKAAKVAGKALMGMAVAGTAISLMQDELGNIGSEQLIRRLRESGDAIESINASIREVNTNGSDVQDLGKALQVAFDPNWIDQTGKALDGIGSFFGVEASGEFAVANRHLSDLDATLSQLVSGGNAAGAKEMFRAITDEAARQGISVDELKAKFPQYAEALAGAANQSANAEGASSDLAGGLDEVAAAADDAQDKVEGLADAIRGLGGGFRSEREAARNMRDALREIGDAAGKSADEQEAAFDGAAQASLDYIATLAEGGASEDALAAATRRARAAYIEKIAAVTGNKQAARELADQQGLIPDEVVTQYRQSGIDESRQKVQDLKTKQDALPKHLQTSVTVPGATDSRRNIEKLLTSYTAVPSKKSTSVTAPGAPGAKTSVDNFTFSVGRIPGQKTTTINANTGAAQAALSAIVAGIAAIPSSKTVSIFTTHVDKRASGGIDEFTNRRHDTTLGAMQPGVKGVTKRGILMAEDGAGPWEAFISGHPGKRARSLAIWEDVGRRLGALDGQIVAMASGGVLPQQERARTRYERQRALGWNQSWARPSYTSSSGGGGSVTAVLAAEDRQLLRTFVKVAERTANRPVRLELEGRHVASSMRQLRTDRAGRGPL